MYIHPFIHTSIHPSPTTITTTTTTNNTNNLSLSLNTNDASGTDTGYLAVQVTAGIAYNGTQAEILKSTLPRLSMW